MALRMKKKNMQILLETRIVPFALSVKFPETSVFLKTAILERNAMALLNPYAAH